MRWWPIILLFIWACESESSQSPSVSMEQDPPPPDSTAYYDSLNAHYIPQIRAYFDAKREAGHFNGVYLLADHGYIIDSAAHGWKDYGAKDSLEVGNAFQLASASKPFTAMAILKLVEQGKLELNDSLHHLIPTLPYKGITLEMLLCHRGGLGNYIYFTEYLMKDSAGFLTNQGIVDILQDTIPEIYYPPDRQFDYNNTGFALLALVVEKVSGQPFQSWMKQEVFEPLGMKSTFVIDKNQPLPNHTAKGHLWDYRAPGNDYLNGVVGDKGLYSTAQDLLRFDQALYKEEFLSRQMVELSMQAHNPIQENGKSYGFGWRLLFPDKAERIVFHTGWWQGFRTYFIRYPKTRKTIIVLDNVVRGPFLEIQELVGLISDDY